MSQALGPNTVRRLAFIRFLYGQGLEQTRRPQPLAVTALLSFHDAVEMFLLLAAEHLGVGLDRNTAFDGYWTQIAAQAGVQLPSRNAMRRMNNSRVNFKHHSSMPSSADLDQFRADVTTFLADAAQAVFAVDSAGIDMTDLVPQQDAQARGREAEARAGQGDYAEALALLGQALDQLLDDYSDRKRTRHKKSAFDFAPGNAFSDFDVHEIKEVNRKLGEQIAALTDAAYEVNNALRVIAVGLDYRRYARFDMLMPVTSRMEGKGQRAWLPPSLKVGDEEYQFCKLFVIESALHLAEIDFDLDLGGLWDEYREFIRQRDRTSD